MESGNCGHERLRQVERWRYRKIASLAKSKRQLASKSHQKNFGSLSNKKIHHRTDKKSPLVQEKVQGYRYVLICKIPKLPIKTLLLHQKSPPLISLCIIVIY